MSESKHTPSLTPAQLQALRDIDSGTARYISDLDVRVRGGLERRGLLIWEQSGRWFGRIDPSRTMEAARQAGVYNSRRPFTTARNLGLRDPDETPAAIVRAAPQMLEALREAPTPRDGEPPEFFAVRCLKWLRTHRDPAIAAATGGEQ